MIHVRTPCVTACDAHPELLQIIALQPVSYHVVAASSINSHAGGPGFESLRAHHFFGILREVVFINSGLLILGQVVPEVLH